MTYTEMIKSMKNINDKHQVLEDKLDALTIERNNIIVHKVRELKLFLEEHNLVGDFNDTFDTSCDEGIVRLLEYNFDSQYDILIGRDGMSFQILISPYLINASTSNFSFNVFDFDYVLRTLTN